MKYGKPITEEMIRQFRENYRNDRNAQVLNAAASQNDLSEIAYVPANAAKMKNVFSLEVKTRSITAQKKSGRCWLFAAMNMMREKIAEECNLEKFEFSNNYGAFWDKFEKMNFYLETVIETADRDLIDDRLFDFVRGIGDGGYWAYAVNIIRKYGCVPSTEMIETFQSENTSTMLKVLNTKLHKDALELRELVREGKDPQPRKQEMLNELFKSLCICLGEPVEKFDFEYTDKDGNYHVDRDLTPKAFYDKYVGYDLEEYITVVHAPFEHTPYGKMYRKGYTSNMVESQLDFYNLPLERIKELVIDSLKEGKLVWFACDCGQFGDRAKGIWDDDTFDYGGVLGGLDLQMNKVEKTLIHEARLNHAMCFSGVNFDADGKPNRWKIENSWGEDAGRKGYFVCSDKWFDMYVYEVIINNKFLNDEERAQTEQKPVELQIWDPAL